MQPVEYGNIMNRLVAKDAADRVEKGFALPLFFYKTEGDGAKLKTPDQQPVRLGSEPFDQPFCHQFQPFTSVAKGKTTETKR